VRRGHRPGPGLPQQRRGRHAAGQRV
jgi:hypothetical protein